MFSWFMIAIIAFREVGSDPAKHLWSKYNADDKCDWRLRKVKTISQELCEKHVADQEGRQ